MTNMDMFNLIAGVTSIISLIVSLMTYNKASNIEKNINRINQKVQGDHNQQAGRDIKINQ